MPFGLDKVVDYTPDNDVTKTTEDATYYVSTTGSDATGDGSTSSPFATRQHIYDNVLPTQIDHIIKIKYLDGTFYEAAVLTGKIVGEGRIEVSGNVVTVDDNSGSHYTITAGDDINASGYGELTVAGAGWGVNDYAGKWVLMRKTTSSTAIIYHKYIYIISNTADTLTTTSFGFVPTVGTTEFDIVDFNTKWSGASAAHPNVPQVRDFQGIEVVDTILASAVGGEQTDGLYYRAPVTYEGIIFENGFGYYMQFYRSSAYATGISASAYASPIANVVGNQAGVTQIEVDTTAELYVGMWVNIGSANLYKVIESIDDATHFTIQGAAIDVSDTDPIHYYGVNELFYSADYSTIYVYGTKTDGNVLSFGDANRKSSLTVSACHGDYSNYSPGMKAYSLSAFDNSYANLSNFVLTGAAGKNINSGLQSYGPGAYGYMGKGRII